MSGPFVKKSGKATVNTYHIIEYKRLTGFQTPTKHSKDDIQTKRVEKEARSRGMAKKAYSCGIFKIDRFPKAINKVNICLLHDKMLEQLKLPNPKLLLCQSDGVAMAERWRCGVPIKLSHLGNMVTKSQAIAKKASQKRREHRTNLR